MIQEAYVSFEVAKLLKEKGFSEKCLCSYNANGKFFNLLEDTIDWDYGLTDFNNSSQKDLSYYGIASWMNHVSAPSHQMALAWLREKGIFIEISFARYTSLNSHIDCDWKIYDCNFVVIADADCFCPTYEEAVETALKYSLKSLL